MSEYGHKQDWADRIGRALSSIVVALLAILFAYGYLGHFVGLRGAAASRRGARGWLVWFAPFQPLPHGEPQPRAGASSFGQDQRGDPMR